MQIPSRRREQASSDDYATPQLRAGTNRWLSAMSAVDMFGPSVTGRRKEQGRKEVLMLHPYALRTLSIRSENVYQGFVLASSLSSWIAIVATIPIPGECCDFTRPIDDL